MKPWIRRGALGLGALALVAVAAVLLGEHLGERRTQRKIDLKVTSVPYRTDAAAVERGRYLFNSRGCTECHAVNGGGRTLVDDGKGTKLAGPNITAGNPVLAAYKPEGWVRSVRHGVGADGRVLRLMPSEDYNRLTDDDLAAVVAYARQLAPLGGNPTGTIELPLPARVLYGFGAIPDAFEKIDHSLAPSQPVAEAVSAPHGRYVAQMCTGCHGAAFQGGKIAGAPPNWPPAARLAPGEGSAMVRYPDVATFARMIKTGKRPDGSAIAVMPFESISQMSDTDAQALHVYLAALPSK
ncbi:MAG TPA: cytochrome c [Rubrivivax sp.]